MGIRKEELEFGSGFFGGIFEIVFPKSVMKLLELAYIVLYK